MRVAAFLLGVVVALPAASRPARAQDMTEIVLARQLPAPAGAVELDLATGYSQGVGMLTPQRTVADAAGAGLGVSAGVDYRLNRLWSIGVEGQYGEYAARDNSAARGLGIDVGATYHLQPLLRGDPWLRLGAGYRALFESHPPGVPDVSVARHALEVLAVRVGYDVRVSEDVAVGPVLGAGFDLWVWETASTGAAATSDQVATFLFAGVQGRFDLGGTRAGVVEAEVWPPASPVGVTAAQPDSPIAPTVLPSPRVSPSVAAPDAPLQRCRASLDAPEKSPRFDAADSELIATDYEGLRAIATCFTTGPLKGRDLLLVGRTDPRGIDSHNRELGLRRALRVAAALELLGVDAGRIRIVSRGKLEAQGHDEASWALDRRVDIVEQ